MTEQKSNYGLKVMQFIGCILLGVIIVHCKIVYQDNKRNTALLTKKKELVVETWTV